MGRKPIAERDLAYLRQLRDEGLSLAQIAQLFGTTQNAIAKRCVRYGITYGRGHSPANKRANHDASRSDIGKHAAQCGNDPLEKREADFVKRLVSDPRTQMYEYVGGYKSRHDKCIVRCRKCGDLKEAAPKTLFSNKYDHHVCFNCQRIERERTKAGKKAQYEAFCAEEYAKDKICVTCGSVYHSTSDTSKYCSPKCKSKRRDSTHKGRARYYGVEYDQSITWRSLAKKLGHCNCEICGQPCDPDDTSWGLIGPLYPTVDCIIAMSNGGGYVWENVQLAHAICNSAKRDLIEQNEIEEAVGKHGPNGGRDEKRHEVGPIEAACA